MYKSTDAGKTWVHLGLRDSQMKMCIRDRAGVFQFDGQGNVTGSWQQVSNSASTNLPATGTYTVTGACLGTISLTDTANNTYSGTISVYGMDTSGYPNDFELAMTTPQLIFTGTGRATFVNPGEAVDNNCLLYTSRCV